MESRLQLSGFDLFHVTATPRRESRQGVVVLQEIFGVNSHIRDVTRRWANLGFESVAPALFDPIEKNVELDYTPESFPRGRDLIQRLGWDEALRGTQVAIDFLRETCASVHLVGFCWGGSVAFLAASKARGVHRASCYYGRHIASDFLNLEPRAPVMFHYGRRDSSIPMEAVEKVRAALPKAPLFVYEAGHGFNCDQRADFDAESAKLAEQRTLNFFLEK